MTNYSKLITSKMLFAVCATFTGGAFLQSFLKAVEITSNVISLYSTVISVVQIAALVLAFFIIDKIKKIKLVAGTAILSYLILCLSILYINNLTQIPANPLPVFLAGIIVYFLYGMYQSVDYKLPLLVMDKKNFGKYVSVCAVLQQVFSICFTVIMSVLVNVMEYKAFINLFVTIAAVFGVVASLFLFMLKVDRSKETESVSNGKRKFTLFYRFLFADFLKGMSTGIMGLTILFAALYHLTDQKISAYYVTIAGIAAMTGSFLTVFLNKNKEGKNIFISSLIAAPLFVLTFVFGNSYVFLVLAFIRIVANCCETIFVPIYISKIIPKKELGAYTSRKTIVSIAGQSVATFAVGFIIHSSSWAFVAIICAAIFEMLSGLLYFLDTKRVTPEQIDSTPQTL